MTPNNGYSWLMHTLEVVETLDVLPSLWPRWMRPRLVFLAVPLVLLAHCQPTKRTFDPDLLAIVLCDFE